MTSAPLLTGPGIGWRSELDGFLVELTESGGGLAFTEQIAERVRHGVPDGLRTLMERGVPVVAHGVSLGLAGADRPAKEKLAQLAEAAVTLGSPLVSEHVAFVRATKPAEAPDLHADVLEARHLVPGPRTRESLDVLVENVREAMDALPVPLAMENPAGTLAWPEDELDEPSYLAELTERTGCLLLLDLANLYVSCRAFGGDPHALLERMPLERVAYAHIAGGAEHDGVYLDSHAHDIPDPVFDLLRHFHDLTSGRTPGVMIERDDDIDVPTTRREWGVMRSILG